MSYEIHLKIPEDSQGGHLIASLSAEEHITPSQAVERIIDRAAQPQTISGAERLINDPLTAEEKASVVAATEARQKRIAARQAKREDLAKIKPETPDVLIGFLASAPDVAENIRRLAYERRSQAFGKY